MQIIESVITKATEKFIDSIIDTIPKKILSNYEVREIKNADFTPYINSLAYTKTLYSNTQPILIEEFYCPPRVFVPPRRRNISLEDCLEIIQSRNILLCAQMGQGKSTFLKHLTLQLINKNKIALFYELRFFKENDDLVSNVIGLLESITKKEVITKDVFLKLIETGNVYLILDGYDEIPSSAAGKFAKDLKSLSLNNNLHIVLSSRPEYYASYVAKNFYSLELDKYEFKDQIQLVTKLITQKNKQELDFDNTENQLEIDEIIKQIKYSEIGVQDLLQTPLMVLLFIMRLQSKYTPAKNLKEFFTELFQVAFIRHDITKNNFKRERKSLLGDTELLDIFKTFCFDTKQSSQITFNEHECIAKLNDILKELDLHERATGQEVFNEYTQVICFIVNLGSNSYGFLHRSIQDFYAALFISERDKRDKESFYRDIIERQYHEFYPCIFFLKEIDKYSFIENVEQPILRKFLERFNKLEINLDARLPLIFKERFPVADWYAWNIKKEFLNNGEQDSGYVEDLEEIASKITILEEKLLKLNNYLKNNISVSKRRFSNDYHVEWDDDL